MIPLDDDDDDDGDDDEDVVYIWGLKSAWRFIHDKSLLKLCLSLKMSYSIVNTSMLYSCQKPKYRSPPT